MKLHSGATGTYASLLQCQAGREQSTGQNPFCKTATEAFFPVSIPYGQEHRATLPCLQLKMLKVLCYLLLPGALLSGACVGQTQLLLGPASFLTPFWQLMTLTEVGSSLGSIAKILFWAVVRLHTAWCPVQHVSDTHAQHHESAIQ